MDFIKHIIILISFSVFSQQTVETILIKKSELKQETPVGIDAFGTLYTIDHAVLSKRISNKTVTYSNVQLGKITSANIYNPLKINVFYKDFNTVIILDNRLAEIFKIDFNATQPYKNISHISTGADNTLWVFNQDTQQLEVYDYKTRTTRAKTLPIQSPIIDIKSNFNYCWLLTDAYLLTYNYFGILVSKIKNEGYASLAENDENIILKKDNSLFYLKKNTKNTIPISMPDLLIKQFFVTNESLYIYNNETLYQFQLKTN